MASPDAGLTDAGMLNSEPDAGGFTDPADAGSLPLNEHAGLQALFRFPVPASPFFGTPHLTRALSLPDGTFAVANSLAVAVYRRTATGLEQVAWIDNEGLRCTTIAFHEATHSLLCGSADWGGIFSIDTSTWKLRSPPQRPWEGQKGFRQIFMQGSTLYLAAFQQGLRRATIQADGSVGTTIPFASGEFVAVDGDDSNMVALARDKGLVLFRPQESSQPVISLPLNGPPIGLRVRDRKAIVALGSQGVLVVDLKKEAVVAEVHPPCVVFSADLSGTRLAVGCSTAILDYDLSQDPPHLFGYDKAEYGITDVLYRDEEVLAVDWRNLVGYRENLVGHVLQVDILAGIPLPPDVSAQVKVRNLGDETLHILGGPEVPPSADVEWMGPPEATGPHAVTGIVTEEEPARGPFFAIPRNADALNLGDTFPIEAPSSYVTFISPDCALQWPALEDLSWLKKNGGLMGVFQPLVIMVPSSDGDPFQLKDFPVLWGLEMKPLQGYYPGVASMQTFVERFSKTDEIPGADTTSDWSIDVEGQVIGFDRVYRGLYPLR